MPSMSSLRFASIVALAAGTALSWSNSDQESLRALSAEDACAADQESCSLSFRQLRGEQAAGALDLHGIEGPKDDEEEESDEGEEEDEDDEGEEDDWYGDEDDEEEKRGPMCCQFGQGKGAKDLSDVGASCYPSSKPEAYDFCDNEDICLSDCNGTWLVGFCALNTTSTSEEACGLELNEAENGYEYTGATNRAVMDHPCAASADACSGCNGTWCTYVKTPIY